MKELVSPHLDDVVYSCWHQLDEQAHVTTVFTGFPSDEKPSDWDISTGFMNSREAFEARKSENRAALQPTSATTTDLDLLDVMYRDSGADYLAEATQAVLANVSLANKVYFPLGFSFNYLHPDHVLLREVGKILLHQGVDVSFYADLPYCVAPDHSERWPGNLPQDRLSQILGGNIHIEPVRLNPTQAAAKFAAVRKYASQFDRNDSLSGHVLSNRSTYEWEAIVKVT
jgi:LmbE family N-acetylglucosaminyl deacetylase